jgi:malonyl-CoA O-methyltransferase
MEQIALERSIKKAFLWIENNSIQNEGIIVNTQMKISYPEVTGYYIPTLLTWNDKERAIAYSQWLCEVQHESGSWRDPAGKIDCIFDTGQIFRGLLEVYELNHDDNIKQALQKACQWLLTQIDDDGVIDAPDVAAWDGTVPDYILLYALEPILRVATLLKDEALILKSKKAIDNFLSKTDLTNFSCLSHFHAYIMEALCDLGYRERALEGMSIIEKLQRKDGSVPAYIDKKWVCSTAMFQYAIVWYKLDKTEQADKVFTYALNLQNSSGGWYGSYGEPYKTLSKLGRFIPSFGMYFPKAEISWAVKYFLDATELYMKNKNIDLSNFIQIKD